ncbi:MAG: hypothetical protein MJK14_03675, partial [Rivularia sp. ALOHA_DT_140]|nr:hypothetical protein [Rivularia sp. ALOHA_DT_140]
DVKENYIVINHISESGVIKEEIELISGEVLINEIEIKKKNDNYYEFFNTLIKEFAIKTYDYSKDNTRISEQ